jgi:cyclase
VNEASATGTLERLGDGVFAWVQSPAGHSHPNAGVVIDDDGLTVVDTLCVPSQSEAMAAALEPLGLPVRRALYSSSHIAHVGGSPTFWMAARYGRSHTSAMLDQPTNPDTLGRLHPSLSAQFDELVTRPVSHTVDTAAWLSPTVCAVPTQGESAENLVALLPERGVLFAGAMGCFGVTPNAFDGDPVAWAEALGELEDLAAVIVPGVGAVGGPQELVAQQAYLYACADAQGDPEKIPAGPWDGWPDRHLDAVNVERAARLADGDTSVPQSMLQLLGMQP